MRKVVTGKKAFPARLVTRIESGHILGWTAFLAPPLSVLAPLGLAPLLVVSSAAIAALQWYRGEISLFRQRRLFLLVAVALMWAGLSIAWSIDYRVGVVAWPKIAAIFLCGLVLVNAAAGFHEDMRRRVGRLLAGGLLVGVLTVLVERFLGLPLHRLWYDIAAGPDQPFWILNRSATTLTLFAIPAAVAVWNRRGILGMGLWCAVFVSVLFLDSAAAVLGMLAGLAAFAVVLSAPRRGVYALAAVALAVMLAAPAIPRLLPAQAVLKDSESGDTLIPRSAYHRLLIWEFTASRIAERPLFGWGLNTSRVMLGGNELFKGEPALPLHPHNAALQIWLELGMLGAALAGVLLAWILHGVKLCVAPGWRRGGAAAAVMAALAIAQVSYGIWQSWWLSVLWMSAAFTIAVVRSGTEAEWRRDRSRQAEGLLTSSH